MAKRKPLAHPGHMRLLFAPRERLHELDSEIREHLRKCRELCVPPGSEVGAATLALAKLRQEVYEDINQLLHQTLIVMASVHFQMLTAYQGVPLEWWHHPKQTSAPKEPDLRGVSANRILISAEVTSSLKPSGSILTRMKEKLEMMQKEFEGELYFVVASDDMALAAKNLITRMDAKIQVLTLHLTAQS